MKKTFSIIIFLLAAFAIGFADYSSNDDKNTDSPDGTENVVPGSNQKVLITVGA